MSDVEDELPPAAAGAAGEEEEDEFAGLPEEEEEFDDDGSGSGSDAGGSDDDDEEGGGGANEGEEEDGEQEPGSAAAADGDDDGDAAPAAASKKKQRQHKDSQKKKKKARRGSAGGSGSGGGGGSASLADSSEEEDGSEANEYEADGFLVDEEEGEELADGDEEDGGAAAGGRRKKRRRRREFALDEEDYELLEDNQVQVRRPQEQRKRLKRQGGDEGRGHKASGAAQLQEELFGEGDLEDELADLVDDDDADGAGGARGGGRGGSGRGGAGGRDGRDGDRDGGGGRDRGGRDGGRGGYDDELMLGGSDEMDDFIADGPRRRAARDARVAKAAGLSTEAVQAANRMFGNFGELLDLHQSHREFGGGAGGLESGDDEYEDEEEDEGEEALASEGGGGEAAQRQRLARQERRAAKKQQRLLQHVDPELVDSHFLRPHDHTIRATDLPERLQLLGRTALEGLHEEARQQLLHDAARFVAEQLFGPNAPAGKVREVVEDGVLEVTGDYSGPYAAPAAPEGEPSTSHKWPPWMLEEVDHHEYMDLRNNRALLARRGRRHPRAYSDSTEALRREEAKLLANWRSDPATLDGLTKSVKAVLVEIFEKGDEVPVLAMFRKEACGELLALRETDTPETTGNEKKQLSQPDVRHPRGTIQARHRRIRRWDVLWAVHNAAVRFFEMHRRRQQRVEAYDKMYERAVLDDEKDALASCRVMLSGRVLPPAELEDVDAKYRHAVEVAAAFDALSLQDGAAGEDSAAGAANGRAAAAAAAAGGGASARPLKRPGRGALLRRYVQRGLLAEAHQLFITMAAFSENMERHEAMAMPDDPDVPPLEWAADKIQSLGLADDPRTPELARPEGLLRGLAELLGAELAAEPALRRAMRAVVYENATLSTRPTAAGLDVLDPFHPYGIAKHLQDKKISSFEGEDTWLRVLAAEKAGLVKLDIGLREHDLLGALEGLHELYTSDNIAQVADEWNAWRARVLRDAVQQRLLPSLLAEVRGRLTANAVDTVLLQVQDRFWHFVSCPPQRILEAADSEEAEPVPVEAPRYAAVVWGAGGAAGEATTIVQLDGQGNLKDLLTAPQLSGNVPRTVNSGSREKPVFDPAADPKKSRDSHKLRDKILEHRPNAILVATNAPQCKQLKDDMEKISQYTESDPRYKDALQHLENKRVEVHWGDHRLAALWANSDAAKAELPDHNFLVRMAVGVGRLALDPLAVIASLCGPKREVLSLRLHELQDALPQDVLAQRLEQTLITGVAQVGADINAMVASPWRQPPLAFVPGLGPRKARALLAAVAASDDPYVRQRVDLLRAGADDSAFGGGGGGGVSGAGGDLAQLGTCVFQNAAAFLRVRQGCVAALNNEADFEPLDDMRVHPVTEQLVQLIVDEAYPDLAEQNGGQVDLRVALEHPDTLQALDLHALAETNSQLHKLPTLSDIMAELAAPYGEVRLSAASPSDDEAFFLCHNETRESLRAGRLVEAKVVWVGESEVKVVIQANSMEAHIPIDRVSSSVAQPELLKPLSNHFKPGQVVTARIYATQADGGGAAEGDEFGDEQRRRYAVTLSTASAFLQDAARWEAEYCAKQDKAYRPPPPGNAAAAAAAAAAGGATPAAGLATPARRAAGGGKARPLQPRPVHHPLWRNQRTAEVAEELKALPVGSALFRPAQKPSLAQQLAHFALSIKLADVPDSGPLLLHVEVREAPDKPARKAALQPPFHITITPKAPEATYEELDEIIAYYVEPLIEHVTQLTKHRRFMAGDSEAVTRALRQQMGQPENAGKAMYCLALDPQHPGTGCVAFCAGGATSSVHREWFNITPRGFFFRGRTYSSVEKVADVFKRDPNYTKSKAVADIGRAAAAAGLPAAAAGMPAGGYGVGVGGYGAPAAGMGGVVAAPAGYALAAPAGYAAAAADPYGGGGGGYPMPPQQQQQHGYVAAAAAAPGGGYQQQYPAAPGGGYGAGPGGFAGGGYQAVQAPLPPGPPLPPGGYGGPPGPPGPGGGYPMPPPQQQQQQQYY